MKKISWDSISEQHDPAAIEREKQLREARSEAIRYIGIAARSSGAVAAFLERKMYAAEIISEVMVQLREEKYLDDTRPARRTLRERTGTKAESCLALRNRMLRQGIAPEVVDQFSDQMIPDSESALQLTRIRYKRELQLLSMFDQEERQKLYGKIGRFLQSRGYAVNVIESTITKVFTENAAE